MTNAYSARPWLKLYQSGHDEAAQAPSDLLSIYRAALQRDPAAAAVHYFGSTYSYAWLDAQSDALAVWLAEEGHVCRGDRIAVILQNVPQFVLAAVAGWKLGAVPMLCNPMYKEFELAALFSDGAPAAVICHREQGACVQRALAAAGVALAERVLTVCPREMQNRDDERVLPASVERPAGTGDFTAAIASRSGRHPAPFAPTPEDCALLLYTSGTTGVPKGAVISHRALAFNVHAARRGCTVRLGARVFGLAPLFHITGFALQLGTAFYSVGSLVLFYRFEPRVALDVLLETRPAHVVGAITAYIALMNSPRATPAHFASFDTLISGGAPIPPSVVRQFAAKLGRRIRSGYGMTELSGASHFAPCEVIPVDTSHGRAVDRSAAAWGRCRGAGRFGPAAPGRRGRRAGDPRASADGWLPQQGRGHG